MEQLIDQVTEISVIILSLIAVIVCANNWFRGVREYAALGYLIACSYLFIIYVAFNILNTPADERRYWARIGYIIFLANIIIWRMKFFISQRRKHAGLHN